MGEVAEYSTYEEPAVRDALAGRKLAGPGAEHKTIEAIEVVTLDPIEPRDPAPLFLDAAHATTRRSIVLRELLLSVGEPYQRTLADESARNLRRLPQFSLVIVTVVEGSRPDTVRLLVVTKDVWSLFVDFEVIYGPGGLDRLYLKPRESNVAGTHRTAWLETTVRPLSWSLALGLADPRVEGQRLAWSGSGGVIVHRETKQLEGGTGTFSVSRPLFATTATWGFLAGMDVKQEIVRRYVDARVALYEGALPWAWRARTLTWGANVSRSFGRVHKLDLSLGVEATRRAYEVPDANGYPAGSVTNFLQGEVPRGERRVGPWLQARAYTARFLRTWDVETLGLAEDVPLGPEVVARVYAPLKGLSDRALLGASLGLRETVALGDGFGALSVSASVETSGGAIQDLGLASHLRVVSPRTPIGRVVFDGQGLLRPRNSLRARSVLGGEGELRGYPTRFLSGENLVTAHVELRSPSVVLAGLVFGGVGFYDVGDAFGPERALSPRHALGAGLRLVAPQIDRVAVRLDFAFGSPFTQRTPGVDPFTVFLAFTPAFDLPGVGGPTTAALASTRPTVGGGLWP